MNLHDATKRLDELSDFKPGWLDGEGEVPTPEGIVWLKSWFERRFDAELELPYLFLTEEGFVLAEWDLPQGYASLTIDTGKKAGELAVVRTGVELASINALIDLDSDSDCWDRVNEVIRGLGGTAGQAQSRAVPTS
mgnify:CR=1 FL=1